jgi:hypothetical protein
MRQKSKTWERNVKIFSSWHIKAAYSGQPNGDIEATAFAADPYAHPAISGMSERERGDLPVTRAAGPSETHCTDAAPQYGPVAWLQPHRFASHLPA